ncbi:MAG: oxygen-independent coproporphyrinogen III oxidase [Hyphomonadaceae bacterium]|nr:MAG: oxygen-independent coproporphyrinogen III oxidase [Caulobacteraceae bacterium]MBT9446978.1 oxygen-independent coproporphyrinogen III oxidase [Hyphomonadaceae bacterium]TPW08153.1 MAG: oxygen-independent coproporphyrinogen III oxidase [Alphaproteobacteria bacterium]
MDERHAPYAEMNLPRYTSYPTAPHFSPDVGAETHGAWLADLAGSGAPLSVYLHIPFCKEICWYCGCNTKAARRREPVADYVDVLREEIALVSGMTGKGGVRRIHWGGGTPNILSEADLDAVMSSLRDRFDLTAVSEHAIEIDPRTLTQAHVNAFARAGVTRASLGVQDFNAHVQAAIGRIQPAETVARAVTMLRDAGVTGISFDLMYGLPSQSVDDARRSARMALALGPDRLSVFGYAHVPWFKSRQRLIDADTLPDIRMRGAQAAAVTETILEAGYMEIGLDHYARPDDLLARAARDGGLHRNFQGYVDDDCATLIGLGASAISNFPQGYAQNSPDVGQWSRAVRAGVLPTARGYALTPDDRIRKGIIERILCDFEVDLAPLGGNAAFPEAVARLAQPARDGLVTLQGDRLSIPQDARRLARVVASAFDSHHQASPARHSRAV